MDAGAGGELVAVPAGRVTLSDRRTRSSWPVEVASFRRNADGQIHPVGGKRPNAWGLYDMLGNVWDWCWDVYDAEVYGTYRVLRGGGWFDEHWSCRASVRRRSHPDLTLDDVGFRVARPAA